MKDIPPHIQQQLTNAPVVSFDVFDTLLVRPYTIPNHLFWAMEQDVLALTGDAYLKFRDYRIEAEQLARRRAREEAGHPETTLDEIYVELGHLTALDDSMIERIKALELAHELRACKPHPIAKLLFDFCHHAGKRLIGVSDMYLSSEFIQQLIDENGFGDISHIYVSSEIRKTKARGDLFPHVLSEERISASQLVHLGDNPISDVRNAQKHGITSIFLPRYIDRFFENKRNQEIWGRAEYTPDVETSMMVERIARKHYLETDPFSPEPNTKESLSEGWHTIGYHVVGPLYLGFIHWLLKQSIQDGLSHLFFLARDGFIMQKVYDLLTPYFNAAPTSDYLYASRRALGIARADRMDNFTLDFVTQYAQNKPIRYFLDRIDLPHDAVPEAVLGQHGFHSLDDSIATENDYRRLRGVFKELAPQLATLAHTERAALQDYFSYYAMQQREDAALVDIGWSGTMQYALNHLLREGKNPLPAYYLGTHPGYKIAAKSGQKMRGYLFEGGEPHGRWLELIECIEIIELFFSAPHGTLLRFEKGERGDAIPVLDDVDCTASKLKAVNELQESALSFIRDFCAAHGEQLPELNFNPEIASLPLRKLITQPTLKETHVFDDIIHIQDIGRAEATRQLIQDAPPFLFLRPRTFARLFKTVYWRKGFLKRIGTFNAWYYARLVATLQWMRQSRNSRLGRTLHSLIRRI